LFSEWIVLPDPAFESARIGVVQYDPVMTVIPPYVNYPPELAYPPVQRTDISDLVAKEVGQSRRVYFAGDIERTIWQSGNTDLSPGRSFPRCPRGTTLRSTNCAATP
jgi:hypothetical protein